MKHDIDLFGTDYPMDHRWDQDQDQNAGLLNIVFRGGAFGHFLGYFLERFSTRTPDVAVLPFTDTGTSHVLRNKDFSGLIQRYHQSFINDNEGNTNLPICLIAPSTRKTFPVSEEGTVVQGR